MTLKDLNNIISNFFSQKSAKIPTVKVFNFKTVLIYLLIFSLSLGTFIFYSQQLKSYKKLTNNNVENVSKSSELIDFKKFLLNKITSPYSEYKIYQEKIDNYDCNNKCYRCRSKL